MKTPSPQEAAKTGMDRVTIYENVPMTQRGGTEMEAATWAIEKAEELASPNFQSMDKFLDHRDAIKAALLEEDKNGYERGRKDLIEDISDVIADDKHADNLAILRAVVQYLDKARLDLRKANGK